MVSVNALIWWFVRSRVPSSQQQKKHDNRSKWSECEKIHRFTSEQFIVHQIIRFYNKSAQNIDLWLCVFFSGGVEHFFACIPYHDIAGWCCLMFHTLWFCVIFILFVFYGWHALFCSIRCNMFAICKAFGPFCHRHFVDFTSLSASCNVLILMYFSIHFSFWKLNNLVCWTNQSSIDWDNVCVPTEIQQKMSMTFHAFVVNVEEKVMKNECENLARSFVVVALERKVFGPDWGLRLLLSSLQFF